MKQKKTVKSICEVIRDWHVQARKLNLAKREIELMETAFEHDDLLIGLGLKKMGYWKSG